jgi:hypothetical protein
MWRSAALAVPLAAVVVASAAAARDPWDPHTKINKSDQAAASAAVVSRADLGPGWSGGALTPTSFKAPTCPAQRPNDGDLTVTAHAESNFNNGNGGLQVDSDIEVFPTVKQAAARFDRFIQPKLAACLAYDLRKSFGTAKITILKMQRLKFAQVANRTAVFRVPVVYQQVTVDSDFVFIGQGRSQFYVNVVAPSNVEGQLPAFELRLAKQLVKRAVR